MEDHQNLSIGVLREALSHTLVGRVEINEEIFELIWLRLIMEYFESSIKSNVPGMAKSYRASVGPSTAISGERFSQSPRYLFAAACMKRSAWVSLRETTDSL